MKNQPLEIIFSEDYATLLHAEPVMEYWLDILCFGSIEEKQELFPKGRKEVEEVGERVQTSRKHLTVVLRKATLQCSVLAFVFIECPVVGK